MSAITVSGLSCRALRVATLGGSGGTRRSQRSVLVAESEAEFLSKVRKLCFFYGLACYHTYRSDRSEPGYPDLTIVGARGVMFRELKVESGRVTPMQKYWLDAMRSAGLDADVWKPSDFPDRVQRELKALGRVRVERPPVRYKRRQPSAKTTSL